MPPVALVVPGRIDARTGGSIYDRRMAEGLREYGWLVDVRELEDSFPFPTQPALDHANRVLAGIREGTVVVIDGLALSAMPDVIECHALRLRVVALVHLPLAADRSRDDDTAAGFEDGERRALAASALVVVTGSATVSLLERYTLPRERVVVVEPGTDRAPIARGSKGVTRQLLCVATIGPGKGHELLLQALHDTRRDNWRLTCAGSTTRHPATTERVRALARSLGFEDRVAFVGDLDEEQLADCYARADVFVLATLQETYGMAVAEALAHGLPVVGTRTGAIASLVGDDAGLLVQPGDTTALAEALARVLGDSALRERLADGARRVRDRLPTWRQAVDHMHTVLTRLHRRG